MLLGPPELPPDPPAAVQVPATEPSTFAAGPLEIAWDAPAQCGTAENLDTQVRRYLAESPDEPLHISGVVEQRPDRWHISLTLRRTGQTTVRELDAPSCEMLTKAVALVVAVHVDVVGTSQGVRELETPPVEPGSLDPELPEPEAPDGPTAAPIIDDVGPPETDTVRTTRPEPPPRRRPPRQRPEQAGLLRVVTHAGVGDRPGFFGGVGLVGGLQLRAFRAEAQLDYTVPRTAEQPDDDQISASFQGLHGTLRGCWVSRFERFEIPLCGGIRVGGLRGVARRGADEPEAGWSTWAGATVEPGVVYSPVPRFGIYGGLGVLIAFRRPSFTVGRAAGPIYTSSSIGAMVSFGVELKLF